MRAVVQRVTRASVTVDDQVIGSIGRGLLILLGVGPADDEQIARHLAERIVGLRIHADDQGRMNRDLAAVGGAALVVSQFTLFADASRGHRPSFLSAGPPALAEPLCATFVEAIGNLGIPVQTGRFAAHMAVDLVNDGPITLSLTSGEQGWGSDAG